MEVENLQKKIKSLNYLSRNYLFLKSLSDKDLRSKSRGMFNLENHKSDLVYGKISEIRSENIDRFLRGEGDYYKRMIDLCDVAIDLLKRRKMNEETYKFFRDTPKDKIYISIPDTRDFLKKLGNQL